MDPIAEMFSQIKNAQNARHEKVVVKFSKIKLAILAILKEHHQIADFRVQEKKILSKDKKNSNKISAQGQPSSGWKRIEIDLLDENKIDIRRVSRPGRRVYAGFANIPYSQKKQAIVIISTSKGVLEGEVARKKGLGGEVIAEIR